MYREIGARLGEANTLSSLGQAALAAGDQAEADVLLEQALNIYRFIGDRYSIPAQIGNYGWTLRRLGRPQEARPYLRQAAELFDQIGLPEYAERHRRAAEA